MFSRLTLFTNIGEATGRFLSDFSYVLSTLVAYVLLSVATYVSIKLVVPSGPVGHLFMAYELATGSDPLNFVTTLQRHRLLWYWILAFHILSWLIVPVLAGTAVSAAFHVWQEKRAALDQQLLATMGNVIRAHGGLSEAAARELLEQARAEMMHDARSARRRN